MDASKIATIAIVLVVAVGVSYLAYQYSATSQFLEETADWETYTNEKYGFELKFPQSWDGYKVSGDEYPSYSYTAFSFDAPHQPFTIFQIVQYTKEQWESLGGNIPVTILSQSNDSILACDGCCKEGDADFQGGGQFDEFQTERCKEASKIVRTFRAL